MSKVIVKTRKAPEAIGPYSQGAVFDRLIFTSGQLPINPETGIMPEGIEQQAQQALKNVRAVLEAAGSSMNQAMKLTVFLTNMDDFASVNKVYSTFFDAEPPCRSAIEVSCLPKSASIEIEAIAYR